MKRDSYLWMPFVILLLVVAGCGSGKGNGAKNMTDSNITISKISPEVGIVLKLLTGQTIQTSEEKNQLQKRIGSQTGTSSILWKQRSGSLINPIAKDGSCTYGGWEKYIPENLNSNTVRQTFIYDKCKKAHPVNSDIIVRYSGSKIIDLTDPGYQGSDPLRDPYFMAREQISNVENFSWEHYDPYGVLLAYGEYPGQYYYRSAWEFDKIPDLEIQMGLSPYYISKDSIWVSGLARDVNTQGTPNDPSDDYLYEGVWDNYSSEDYFSDYYYDEQTKSGYARLSKGTENGYKEVTRESRKTGEKYSFGARYEDFTTESYRANDSWYYSMDGVITPDSCSSKKIMIKTIQSLYQPFNSPCPLEGEIVVTSEDKEVTLRFRENQTVEVDTTGDGVADDIMSCQVVMDSDFCM